MRQTGYFTIKIPRPVAIAAHRHMYGRKPENDGDLRAMCEGIVITSLEDYASYEDSDSEWEARQAEQAACDKGAQ